ncbi:MAG: hypothetical protein M3463_08725 [Verrucomicrobiota bacterium]|nr:hypothetical protein [Verrucomicrobiota bacterium]
MIASVEATIIYLLIAAAIGVINWLANRKSETQNPPPNHPPEPGSSPTFPRPVQRTPRPDDSEDERVRKLMEALGLPSDQPPPQSPPRPARSAPPPLPPRRERPERTPAPRRVERRAPGPVARPAEPSPATLRETVPRVPEPPQLPALHVDALPEIHTLASTISASGPGASSGPESDAYALSAQRQQQPILRAASLREGLRSPADVRRAILLREILGPPKGLPG